MQREILQQNGKKIQIILQKLFLRFKMENFKPFFCISALSKFCSVCCYVTYKNGITEKNSNLYETSLQGIPGPAGPIGPPGPPGLPVSTRQKNFTRLTYK